MAADGQCIYNQLNIIDGPVPMWKFAFRKSLSLVLCPYQHNYYSIKRPLEFHIHCSSNILLFNSGNFDRNKESPKFQCKICEKKHGFINGFSRDRHTFLSGRLG